MIAKVAETSKTEDLYKELTPVLIPAARINFWAFCCWMDWDFFRVRRRFFKEIALTLQKVVDEYEQGRAIKVSISMPPRAGKSYIVSLFAAYWLGRFPELSVMRNTCTATLYDKFSYDTRAIVRSAKFRSVFPVQLSKDKQNLGGWNLSTSKQVGYFGAGVGGTIIGFGANLAITDDLYSGMTDAMSDTMQARTKMWKSSEHNSRMEKNCPEIFVGTRWTKNDVIGEAIDSGEMAEVIQVPAMVDGRSFCEDVKSTEEYQKIRESLMVGEHDGMVWLAEYMQEPTEAEGVLLPIDRLQFADLTNMTYNYVFAVGDPADHGGDKYACPFVGVRVSQVNRNGHMVNELMCYVISAICNNDGIEANSAQIFERFKRYKPEKIFIESNGVGLASVLALQKILGQAVAPFNSTDNKDVRILSNYEFIERHFVFDKAYKSDRQYTQFISDLTSFSKDGQNKHKKDAIDVLSTAAEIVKIKYRSVLF